MIPQAVLMRSGLKTINTARLRATVNAAKPKAVHNAVKRNRFHDGSSSSSNSEFKIGLGYDAAIAASPAVESFLNLSDKSGSDKGYHSVPPPLIRNFIPHKPDLTFMDEIVKSENLEMFTTVLPT
ncbi:hypothetical protein Tco_0738340 [Tanacetum coccineum]